MTRHFLDIAGHQADDLRSILENAKSIKAVRQQVAKDRPLDGKILAMIFDKPSTRTRVSFDVGMRQLGGETIVMDGSSSQLGKGETVADTARVLSRYVDAIMIRTTAHERLLEMAEHATVPVINALTDDTHPCQIMADVMTYEEHRGSITGKTVAWTGDGNNVLSSFLEAGALLDFKVRAATPESRGPDDRYVKWARDNGGDFELFHNADQAVAGADCVVTDKWLSMGQEDDGVGHNTFAPYQVNEALMAKADKDALFMHCLPAHRGEEISHDLLDDKRAVAWQQAENRLHAQKAVMRWCLGA